MPKSEPAVNSSMARFSPCRENICAIIVSYFPDAELVMRVRRIRPQVGHVVIVDNGSDETTFSAARDALKQEGIEIIENSCNFGIARALNQGIEWALGQRFQWALLLDQDTLPFDDMVSKQIGVYREFPEKERLAIIGCSAFPDSSPHNPSTRRAEWATSKAVISSGSLVRLEIARQIGPFREDFFIDCVDFEFCLRACCAGFRIVEVKEALMHHVIGNAQRLPIQWLAKATPNHRPWRTYYITRNLVVLSREFGLKEPAWIWTAIYRRIKTMIVMFVFEEERVQKMKYAALGLYDGLTCRFDRRVIQSPEA
jgi:rhamnosyltransferase